MAHATQQYEPEADLATLRDHPENPRVGDLEAVGTSIDANGFYGAILAQRSTGRILAGHTRRQALLAGGVQHGPVIWVDCDDDTARRILLADNRTAELAAWDDRALADLLQELGGADPAALLGTGFDERELAALTSDLAMPEPIPFEAKDTPPGAYKADREQRYETTALRQIMLVMQADEYEPLVLGLEKLRTEWDVESFTAVVRRLVEERLAMNDTARLGS